MSKINKVKSISTENLPRKGKKIDWINSVGKSFDVNYYGEEVTFTIEEYHKGECAVSIKYDDKEPYKIKTNNLLKVGLAEYLGKFTKEFKCNIGDNICDDKRNLTIIAESHLHIISNGKIEKGKWYKYTCNKCHNEDWIREHQLLEGGGCNVCNATCPKPLLGYNTVYDKDEYATKAIGEELAKVTTCGSDKEVYPKCPICGEIKKEKMKIGTICRDHSIGCPYCSDGVSFPNKVAHYLCLQLYYMGVIDDFKFEKTFSWGKDKIYDVVLEKDNNITILEMDGELGHGNKIHSKSSITLEESLRKDIEKDEAALKNEGTEVIRIDCCYKTFRNRFEYIKNNILNSKLALKYDLSNVDWDLINKQSQNSLVKEACEYKKNDPSLSTTDIAALMHMSESAIYTYLLIGKKLGWCTYDSEIEKERATQKANERAKEEFSKPVLIFDSKTLEYIGEEKSEADLEAVSLEKYGVKLLRSEISLVCRGLRNTYNGFIIKFKNDDDMNIKITDSIRQVCKYKKEHQDATTTELAKIFKKARTTIISYLKKGTMAGLCSYDPNEETDKRIKKLTNINKKNCYTIEVYLNGESKGKFTGYKELEEKSSDLFGIKFNKSGISRTCNGLQDNHKGYVIKKL